MAKVELTEEERKLIIEERKEKKMKGRPPKYKTVEVDANIHVTYSAKEQPQTFLIE